MDSIKQALERARSLNVGDAEEVNDATDSATLNVQRRLLNPGPALANAVAGPGGDITLDRSHLESKRIIAHDEADPRAKSFDMLRTQVLQAMDQKGWKLLGITSPTPGCGKTLTAVNLALSIARQPDRSVLLVDLDLQNPQVANDLGLKGAVSLGRVSGVLEGQTDIANASIAAHVGNCCVMVLPAEAGTSDSSAWMASRAMSALLQDLKRVEQSCTVILDLPPMLSSDDVIAILPQLDCVLLVAAAGKSTVAEIEECDRHLQASEVLRLVLNKVPDRSRRYYYSRSRSD